MVFTYFCTLKELEMQVVSSNIKTADYDRTKRELTLTFINRPRWVYIYYNVPVKIWTQFIKSASKGQFFSDVIRDVYRYRRIIQ